MDIPDKETVARDEKALMERGSDLLTMVTQLGSSERLAEANELSKAKSIEDAVSTVMQTKAAGEINQIVAKAKDVITSEEAKRTLTAKGADLVVATDKWISGGKDSVKSLEVATQSGIDKLIELSDKGEVTKLGKNVIKSAEKVLAELSEGKGLSSSELEAWKSYVLSSNDEAKQASLLANDPNLQEILNKANQLLTRPAAVSLIKNYMGVLKTGAGALVDGAGKLLQDKKSQALLREWTQTGIGVIRTVTADKVYVINKGFKFHVRSEPTMSKSKKTGKVFRSGQMFTVDEVKRDPLGRQTYLHLADNSGWVFTDHPNPKDSRKLISQVSMVDEKGAQSAGTEEKKGSEFASAQKSLVYRGHKLLDITGKRFLGKGADTLLSQGSKIVQHKQTRDKFLREIKDASVEFLLSYLPTLKVGVIEGVKDNVKYKLWDIDLSGFKLVSEKVDVAFDEEALELKVTASNLSCKMQGLSWQYKQQTFPYMSGTGKADAFAADADFRFVLKIEFVTKDEAQRRRREILEREKKRLDEKKKVSAFQVAGRKLRTDKLKRISPAGSDTKQIAGSSGSGQALDSDAKRKPGEQPAPITGEKTPGTKRGSGQSSTERVRPDDEGELSGGVQRDEGNERGDDEAQPSDEAERKGSDLVLQVSLKEKRMRISALDLTFDTGGSLGTWFYNKVSRSRTQHSFISMSKY